jgi:hypothetical protein
MQSKLIAHRYEQSEVIASANAADQQSLSLF